MEFAKELTNSLKRNAILGGIRKRLSQPDAMSFENAFYDAEETAKEKWNATRVVVEVRNPQGEVIKTEGCMRKDGKKVLSKLAQANGFEIGFSYTIREPE